MGKVRVKSNELESARVSLKTSALNIKITLEEANLGELPLTKRQREELEKARLKTRAICKTVTVIAENIFGDV